MDDDVIYLQKKIVEDDLMGFFNSMVAKDSENDDEMQQYFRNQIEVVIAKVTSKFRIKI